MCGSTKVELGFEMSSPILHITSLIAQLQCKR